MAGENVVELVLKAVDATGGELQKIRKELATLAGQAEATGTAGQDMGRGVADGGKKAEDAAKEAEKAAEKSRQAWQQLGLVAAGAFAGLMYTIKQANDASNQLQAAQLGLNSALQATGQSADQARQYLQDFTADGLVTIGAASQALQNLVLRYKDLDTAETILTRLKDAAAFNRQAHLTMDQAVRSASEGLRNEMSQLVDNAGVTKNVSIMWKEYAALIGKGMNDLTQAEKAQAELNGILKETEPQLGNAAKLAQTAAGAQAMFSAETLQAKQTLGQAYAPAIRDVIGILGEVVKGITDVAKAHPELVSSVTAATVAFTGLVGALSAYLMIAPKIVAATRDLELAIFGLKLAAGDVFAVIGLVVGAMALWGAVEGQKAAASRERARIEASNAKVMEELLGKENQDQEQAANVAQQTADKRAQAAEKMRQKLVSEADRLHDSLLSALRQRYQAEEKAEQDSFKKQQELADRTHQARLRQIEEEGQARIDSIQAQIDALDELSQAEDRQARDADRQQRLQDLHEQLNRTSDPEEALRIMQDIAQEEQQLVRDHEQDVIEDKRRSLEQQIQDAQDALDQRKQQADDEYAAQVDTLQKIEAARQDFWQRKMDDQAMEAEVERMVLANDQQAMLELLKAYEPDYFNQGKSFGERMIEGLLGKTPDYEKVLGGMIAEINDADRLIKEAADKAEEEAARAEAAVARLKKAAADARQAMVEYMNAINARGAGQDEQARRDQAANTTGVYGDPVIDGPPAPPPGSQSVPVMGNPIEDTPVGPTAQRVININGDVNLQAPDGYTPEQWAQELEREASLYSGG